MDFIIEASGLLYKSSFQIFNDIISMSLNFSDSFFICCSHIFKNVVFPCPYPADNSITVGVWVSFKKLQKNFPNFSRLGSPLIIKGSFSSIFISVFGRLFCISSFCISSFCISSFCIFSFCIFSLLYKFVKIFHLILYSLLILLIRLWFPFR